MTELYSLKATAVLPGASRFSLGSVTLMRFMLKLSYTENGNNAFPDTNIDLPCWTIGMALEKGFLFFGVWGAGDPPWSVQRGYFCVIIPYFSRRSYSNKN